MALSMIGWAISIGLAVVFTMALVRGFIVPRLHAARVRKALDLPRISSLAGINAKDIHFEIFGYQKVLNAPQRAYHYKVLIQLRGPKKGELISCCPPHHISTLGGNYATQSIIAKEIRSRLESEKQAR